jgi:hypothetical protein
MRSKYEIQEVTVINYAEIELEWTLRDVLSNDIIESGTDVFEYQDDLSATAFSVWENWQSVKDKQLNVAVQVKYGNNGIVEEFIQVEELRYE